MIRAVVIDDNPLIANLLREILMREGIEVYIPQSAIEGVGAIITHKADVVFCDIELWEDGPSGLDVIEGLRKNPWTKNIKIIAMSAREEWKRFAQRAGADKFLKKPFTINDIKKILSELDLLE